MAQTSSKRSKQLVPLYGFLEGDTIGMVIIAYEDDTIQTLAENVQNSASVRVKPTGQRLQVYYQGKLVKDSMTVKEAEIEPLERIDVRVERASKEGLCPESR